MAAMVEGTSIQSLKMQPILGTMTFSGQTDKKSAAEMLEALASKGFSMIGEIDLYKAF